MENKEKKIIVSSKKHEKIKKSFYIVGLVLYANAIAGLCGFGGRIPMSIGCFGVGSIFLIVWVLLCIKKYQVVISDEIVTIKKSFLWSVSYQVVKLDRIKKLNFSHSLLKREKISIYFSKGELFNSGKLEKISFTGFENNGLEIYNELALMLNTSMTEVELIAKSLIK